MSGGDEMDFLLECWVPGCVGPYSQVYAIGHADLSVCQVMSVPAFEAAVLAMLI
jgi:hypothetical protein